jgi:hypothetical protein
MGTFEDFKSTFGPATNCEKVEKAATRAMSKELPADLLDLWRAEGWCAYGDGLLWVVDPRDFEDVVDDWVDLAGGKARVFLRTAFGHLYLWYEGAAYSLDVQRADLSRLSADIGAVFTVLTDEDVQEHILRRDTFREVRKRLGPPGRDECYAFVPAIPLGGPGTSETVQKVKLREHLHLLAQIVQQ